MPNKPETVDLTRNSADILNAIRNNASAQYREFIPAANPDAASVKQIGQIIMQYPALQNEFLSALVNRIGRVLITSKMYSNPWAAFKQGMLEFGETIEEIFVNIAKPFQFDPATAESKVFKREIPDVRAAFHVLNYQKFYKATISNDQLRQAFLSWQGITDLIARIVDSMYTGAAYDEFLSMKYLLARHILQGDLYPVEIPAISAANMKPIISTVKGVSNNLEFMNSRYNWAGVATHSAKDDQFVIVNAEFDAVMDVEVLAAAFNMSKADFMGHRVMIDSFGSLDTDRLNTLFADDPNYTELTDSEIAALDTIPAVLVDRSWFMVFDNLQNFTENFNGEGLYWNYWYHTWKTFSVSPFANAVLFVPGTPAVSAVDVTPAAATVLPGQTLKLTAAVTNAYFASTEVEWTLSVTEGAEISSNGTLYIHPDFWGTDTTTASTTITVTATSVVDSTVTDTATITVTNPAYSG